MLVCTTIIESGLDIPNANTIVINRADRFGLAQLYQLRGRVGRAAVRSYAYLLYDRNQALSPVARDRLVALQEASELGAGFRIAIRDLEIRGAGKLLGRKQSGHIAAVGFDLYCRLLAKAVEDLKEEGRRKGNVGSMQGQGKRREGGDGGANGAERGERLAGRADAVGYDDPMAPAVTLDLPLLAIIPDDYVPDQALRLRMYRRIAGLTDTADVDALAEELVDRFGPLPHEVRESALPGAHQGAGAAGARDGHRARRRSVGAEVRRAGDHRPRAAARAHRRRGPCRARRAVWMPLADAGRSGVAGDPGTGIARDVRARIAEYGVQVER